MIKDIEVREVELYKEIMIKILERERCVVDFPQMRMDMGNMIGGACYKSLLKIKEVIRRETLSDFEIVEEIIRIVEDTGVAV